MKVLVIGSGAREHSIIWKLNQDKNISKIICIGENKGISEICETIDFKYKNINDLKDKILILITHDKSLLKHVTQYAKNQYKVYLCHFLIWVSLSAMNLYR